MSFVKENPERRAFFAAFIDEGWHVYSAVKKETDSQARRAGRTLPCPSTQEAMSAASEAEKLSQVVVGLAGRRCERRSSWPVAPIAAARSSFVCSAR